MALRWKVLAGALCLSSVLQAVVIFPQSEKGPWVILHSRSDQILAETCASASAAKPGCSGRLPFPVTLGLYTARLYLLYGVGDTYSTADGLGKVSALIENVERDLGKEDLSEGKRKRALGRQAELEKLHALMEKARSSILNLITATETEDFDRAYEMPEIERAVLALHPIWSDGVEAWRYVGSVSGEAARGFAVDAWVLPSALRWNEGMRAHLRQTEIGSRLNGDFVIWGDKYQPENWYTTTHSRHYNASRGEYTNSFPAFHGTREAAEEAMAQKMRGQPHYNSISYTGPDRRGSRLQFLDPNSQRENSESAEGPLHHALVIKKLYVEE